MPAARFYSASLISEKARVVGNDDVGVGWFVHRAEGHRDDLRRGLREDQSQFLEEQ